MKRSRYFLMLLIAVLSTWLVTQRSVAAPAGRFAAHIAAVTRALEHGSFALNTWMVNTQVGRRVDPALLRHCAGFTLRVLNPGAIDGLVASGIALAAGRPSIYLTPRRDELPWFLREADGAYPGQVAVKTDNSVRGIVLHPRRVRPVPIAHDTFMGCLMTSLSKAQYAEARTHLAAISQALQTHCGSSRNFCEALRIKSSADFDPPSVALRHDVTAVRSSKRCVFYVYSRAPVGSGMWVETGVALGAGKHCLFLVPDRGALPPCLRGRSLPPHVRIVVYGTHARLMHLLATHPRQLLH